MATKSGLGAEIQSPTGLLLSVCLLFYLLLISQRIKLSIYFIAENLHICICVVVDQNVPKLVTVKS